MLRRVAVITVLAGLLFQAMPNGFPPRDFVEYYSAAKVFAAGGDPYDGTQLLPVQRAITGEANRTVAVSLWTPPYTLALYLPFAGFSFPTAHFLWLLVQTILLATGVELIVLRYGGSRLSPWLAQLIAFAFCPLFWNLHFGQNTGFLLLGLAGFAWFRPTRPMLAGAFAALTAIKPHLLSVFGVLLIWDAGTRAGRRALLGGIAVLLLGSAVALAVQPHIFAWFVEALRRPTTPDTVRLADWQVPLLSYHFRHAVDPDRFWLQFVPLGVACAAVIAWHRKRRVDWTNALPGVVLLSCLVAPYGGWIFDLTVLVLPVFAVLEGVRRYRPPAQKWRGGEGLRPLPAVFLAFAWFSWFGFRIGGLAEPIWFTPGIAVVCGFVWDRVRLSQTLNPKPQTPSDP